MVWAPLLASVALASGTGALVAANRGRFRHRIGREVRALVARSLEHALPTNASAPPASLPVPALRYRDLAVADHQPIRTAKLFHGGTFNVRPGVKPLPIRGVQVFTTDPPGFVWLGSVQVAPGVWIDARDMLADGKGSMHVLLDDTIKLAAEEGTAMNRGAALRMLAEMPWFPTALFDPRYVRWNAIDDQHARATLMLGDNEESCVFEFGEDGLPRSVAAERPYETGEMRPWGGSYGEYRVVDGMKVPFRAEVSWQLPAGPFTYARWILDCVEYDAIDATIGDDELDPA